ncbi:transposase [Cyanobium sp. Cruz-8D1]|nr:transposase [Cyanobium sp. Cruz-8H5]MCP9866641.1 transposase [Cyanobium sp. Cruz-8D1]
MCCFCTPTASACRLSRKIERACYEDLPFRVLSGNQQPDHTRISEFRRRHLELLEDLYGFAEAQGLRAGAQALSEVRPGADGAYGAGRHQGGSQGHEPRAHGEERAATQAGEAGTAEEGRAHRRSGGRPPRQGQAWQ